MKNAHTRIGQLEFTKWTQGKGTRFRVTLDRLVAEPASSQGATAPAHLISVFGNDSEIAAIAAAVSCQESFRIQAPGVSEMRLTLGDETQQFRSSFVLPGRKQPFRHLVALSKALADSRPETSVELSRVILVDQDPTFVLFRLAGTFGLPALPEWASFVVSQLQSQCKIESLIGLGCSPVAVNATKEEILAWIGKGLRQGAIQIPDENNSHWSVSNGFAPEAPSAEVEATA
ncbi:MAG: hypothetical protein L0387_10865 [Acidobacteria bacterium]|nr:hypothetical protein [Acidobacteriota bacterium]MCI0622150.1 hypothetical protein [Acidobacteriota bacterium]